MPILKKFAIIFGYGLLAVFLQGTVLGAFLPKALVPNFILILGVFIALFESSTLGAVLAFSAGLFFDFFSGVLLGPWAGALALIFAGLTLLSRRVFVDAWSAVAVTVFACAFFGNLVYLFLISRFAPAGGDIFSLSMIANCLVTSLIAPPIFAILRTFFVRRGRSLSGRYF